MATSGIGVLGNCPSCRNGALIRSVGWLILMGQTYEYTQVLPIIVIGLIGLVLALIMRWIESKLCAWNIREK